MNSVIIGLLIAALVFFLLLSDIKRVRDRRKQRFERENSKIDNTSLA